MTCLRRTGGSHREFAMASGEMSGAEFQTFNLAWMKAALIALPMAACPAPLSIGGALRPSTRPRRNSASPRSI